VNKLWLRKINKRPDNYPQKPHKSGTGSREFITRDLHSKPIRNTLFIIDKIKLSTTNMFANNSNNKV